MMGDPYVHVECDSCGEVTDFITLTPVAQSSWDARNVPGTLKRWGWAVAGDIHTCPDCQEAQKGKVP